MLEIAKKENPNISFYLYDASKLPFSNSNFDIVSSNLLVHYFKNLSPLFIEISRVLKKNGEFVLSFHHSFNEVEGSYFNLRKYTWKMLGGQMKMTSYHHTFENISICLEKAGFYIKAIREPIPLLKAKKIDQNIYQKQ